MHHCAHVWGCQGGVLASDVTILQDFLMFHMLSVNAHSHQSSDLVYLVH